MYDSLIRHVTVEGYPGKTPGFTEANLNDLVYAILCPLMFNFIKQQNEQGADCRFLHLKREKHIVARDDESRGGEEFVVIGTGESCVFVWRQKWTYCGRAMYDMWVNNGREENDSNEGNNGKGRIITKVLYTVFMTGQDWQTLMYDGKYFVMNCQFPTLFDGFQEEK